MTFMNWIKTLFFKTDRRASSWRHAALLAVFSLVLLGGAPSAHADLETDCAAGSTDKNTLQGGLNTSSLAYISAAIANANKTFSDSVKADNTNNTDGQRGTNKEKQCLKYLTSDYFNNIVDILENLDSASLAKFVKGLLKQLVDKIKGMVCSWVAQQINNLLESVCLPIPSLSSLAISLPSLSASSCSGISLRDLVSFSSDYGNSGSMSLSVTDLSYPNAINYNSNMARGVDPKSGTPLY